MQDPTRQPYWVEPGGEPVVDRSTEEKRTEEAAFRAFVVQAQDPIRRALVTRFGIEVGREAAADALMYAWEHWERISVMENPAGYVYRVGHRRARRVPRTPRLLPAVPSSRLPWVEPRLPVALGHLTSRQRTVVVLVHGYALTHREVASLLGVSRGSVQRHLERGLARLRDNLGVDDA